MDTHASTIGIPILAKGPAVEIRHFVLDVILSKLFMSYKFAEITSKLLRLCFSMKLWSFEASLPAKAIFKSDPYDLDKYFAVNLPVNPVAPQSTVYIFIITITKYLN